MKQKMIGISIGIVLGVALALLQVQTIGFTAAIATPHWFSDLVLDSDYGTSLVIMWELIIVQFIGAGIPTLLIAFILLKFIPFGQYWKALGLIVGAIGGIFILYPAPYFFSPLITHHLYEIMVILCASTMTFLFYKNNSSTANKKITQGI